MRSRRRRVRPSSSSLPMSLRVHDHRSAGWSIERAHQMQERTLAGTARTDDGHERPGLDRRRYLAQRSDDTGTRTVGFGNAIECDRVRTRRRGDTTTSVPARSSQARSSQGCSLDQTRKSAIARQDPACCKLRLHALWRLAKAAWSMEAKPLPAASTQDQRRLFR